MKTNRKGFVELAHGGGGRATGTLVRDLFVKHFTNPRLDLLDDGAMLELSGRLAISTDAFVVDPLFFPGGDIGKLAVCGTVNDVAMCGAAPRFLSAAFVIEEGFELSSLERVVASMAKAARSAGAAVVTGDTKVVPHGRGDGVYITTTGVGEVTGSSRVSGHLARPGDHVLLSGPVGDHGTTILSVRAGIELSGTLRSDCASVAAPVADLLEKVTDVHCLRDPTRGGLAAALNEIAAASEVGIAVRESDVPVSVDTLAACEILGLDPLNMACEGRFVCMLPAEKARQALELLRRRPDCDRVADIGTVTEEHPGKVLLQTAIGGTRLLDLSEGEPLPRIC